MAMTSLAVGRGGGGRRRRRKGCKPCSLVGPGGLSSIRCGVGAIVPQLRLIWLSVAVALCARGFRSGSFMIGICCFLAWLLQPFSLCLPLLAPLGAVSWAGSDPALSELHSPWLRLCADAPLKRWLKGCYYPPTSPPPPPLCWKCPSSEPGAPPVLAGVALGMGDPLTTIGGVCTFPGAFFPHTAYSSGFPQPIFHILSIFGPNCSIAVHQPRGPLVVWG